MSWTSSFPIIVGGDAVSDELFARGLDNDRNMISASAVVNPTYHDLILDVHDAYLKAGMNHLVTSNYHVVPGIGFTSEEIRQYTRVAGRLAFESRQRMNNPDKIKICGSLPPLMPSIRSDRTIEHEEGHEIYQLIGEALWPFVDMYVAESMSCLEEALLAYRAVYHLKKPILISFSLNATGEELRSGESIIDAVEKLLSSMDEMNCLTGILFNRSQPEVIAKALLYLSHHESLQIKLHEHSIMIGGYGDRISPSSKAGQLEKEFVPDTMNPTLDMEIYSSFIRRWMKYGAQIVGGCHHISPRYINHLSQSLTDCS